MMKLKRFLKRITAFSLAVLMTVVAFPCNSVVYAAADDYPPEILFPINVLDFRADNLLFQYVNDWNGGLNPANNGIYFDLYQGAENNGGKGLVEAELGPDGVPVYKKETVVRIAEYVQERLSLRDVNSILDRPIIDGEVNYLSMRNYIKSDPVWLEMEAENGDLANGANLGNNNTGVGNIGANNGIGSVSFPYNANQAGYRTVRLYYATAANRDFNVTVGTDTTTVNSPATGGWWVIGATPVEVSMWMEEGENTITISGNGDFAPNLDYIEIDNAEILYPLGEYDDSKNYFTEDMDPNTDGVQNNRGWTDIRNCMDYAYFVTSNLFKYNASLNTQYDDYQQLVFHKIDDVDANGVKTGKAAYEFMADQHHQDTKLIFNNTENVHTVRNIDMFRAENGVLAGSASLNNVLVNNIGGNDNGTVAFTYEVEEAGGYDISLFYASAQNREFAIDVYDADGNKVGDTITTGNLNSGSWTAINANATVVNVPLVAGENTIVFSGVQTQNAATNVITIANAPNLDYIQILGDTLQAELATLGGGAAHDNLYAMNLGGNDDGSVTFTYETLDAGQYNLSLYYASDANRQFEITVINSATDEDGDTYTSDVLNNNSWNNFGGDPAVVQVALAAGENEIIISGVGNAAAPNLDYVEILNSVPIEGDEIRDGGSLFLADGADKGVLEDIDVNHDGHNFHYTVSSQSYFVYKEGAGQYFYFSGDDDVYVYVNNKLLVDLGGSHDQLDGEFNLEELAKDPKYGLVDGEVVSLSFFYMERQTVASNFYAKLNFQLESDQLKHVFDYQTIPYGFFANLTYSYKAMRELNTNTKFTFTDNFGNTIGADGFVLGKGVSLLNNTLVVTVKDKNGNTDNARSATFQFDDPNNPTSAKDLATIDQLMKYFTELKIERFETLEISGPEFDTSTYPYDDPDDPNQFYQYVQDEYGNNSKVVTFTPKLKYDAWMEGATSPTTNTLTATNPVKVLVGSIKITTAPSEDTDGDGIIEENEVNWKTELKDYEAFTLTRTDKNGEAEVCYTNSAEYGVSEVTLDMLPMGDYTLTIDQSVLTGYTVIIDGEAVVTGTDTAGNTIANTQTYSSMNYETNVNNTMLTIPFNPVYDANTKTWSYPQVQFKLKAVRDLPDLFDLT